MNCCIKGGELVATKVQRVGMYGHTSESVLPVDSKGRSEKITKFFHLKESVKVIDGMPTDLEGEINAWVKIVEFLLKGVYLRFCTCPDA